MGSLSKRLEILSSVLIRTVVIEQAAQGLASLGENSSFFVKIGGVNSTFSVAVLVVLSTVQCLSSVFLCVPRVFENTKMATAMYVAMAVALGFEAFVSSVTGDWSTRTKSVFLCLACLKHATDAACSRSMSVHGSVDVSIADKVSFFLREKATRYKFCSLACVTIVVALLFTVSTSESPLSRAPLTREIGRAQYGRLLAFVAFLSAVGSEDRSGDRGAKKSL